MLRLSRLLDRWGDRVMIAWGRSPHGFQLTLARSVLASSTFLVLLLNPTSVLLHDPSLVGTTPSSCTGIASAGAFCLAPDNLGELVRWLLVAMCIPTLLGVMPAVSAPLHAYAAFSLASNTVGIEGGDYLETTVSVVLAVVCCTDRRWNGWRPRDTALRQRRNIPAHVLLLALKLQLAYVYLEAATVKQAHPIWADGSALWYWVQQPNFGARSEVREFLEWVLSHGTILHAATWGVIVTEYVLAVSVLAARSRTPRLLTLGASATLHLVFSMVLGLVTFEISMLGSMLVLMWRSGDAMPWKVFRLARSGSHERGDGSSRRGPLVQSTEKWSG